jgi:hypothetical protein
MGSTSPFRVDTGSASTNSSSTAQAPTATCASALTFWAANNDNGSTNVDYRPIRPRTHRLVIL